MLTLETKLKIDEKTVSSPNLTDKFTDGDLNAIGNVVWDGFNKDKYSRLKWEKRTQAAMDLAMQVSKDKNFPWPGCSNVAFPLVTIAAMQFQARAYPAIIQGTEIVKYRVNGPDPMGQERARADRIGMHMSYQLMEEDHAWEEQHDRALLNLSIVGCVFKKTYRNGMRGHNVSELVLAQDLIVDYYAKSIETATRKSHVIPMSKNDIHEGIMSGIYRDVRDEKWYQDVAKPYVDTSQIRTDNRTGEMPPYMDQDAPFTFIEQHLWLDLDQDGYKEPYIATIEEESKCLIRLVTRFDDMAAVKRNFKGEIIRIEPIEYFTKYGLIPSPDGSIYDVGFGMLLGPLNESTNSLINQLIDAGTMSNSAGGFLGRGAKIRGGQYTFAPLEWKRVDSTGDDLKKSIFPLPVREPSQVLFALLNLLINYTNRISGSTDTMVGENPGQNTPATTTQTMVEQGMKIYNSIFKRIWRSMKEEFRKLYILNSIFLPERSIFGQQGMQVLREDYAGDPNRISPVADPNVTSDHQRLQQAMALKQSAMGVPGYNIIEVEKNYLKALHIDGWEVFYPGPDKVPPLPNPKAQVEQMKMQIKQADLEFKKQSFIAELLEERRLNNAKIIELEAKAAKYLAEAGGVESGHQIAAFQTAISALKAHDQSIKDRIQLMQKGQEIAHDAIQIADRSGMGRMEGSPGQYGSSQPSEGMAG